MLRQLRRETPKGSSPVRADLSGGRAGEAALAPRGPDVVAAWGKARGYGAIVTERFRYADPGSLSPPGPIGRVIRFILGAYCVYVVLEILAHASGFFAGRAFHERSVWFVILVGVYVFPDVVNIGFGKAWKRSRLLIGLGVLAGAAGLVSWAMHGSAFGPPSAVMATLWLLYTFGHLGISFLLATLLATPGCEMRSVPQLLARVSGRTAMEHYCPGFLTPLDRWETGLRTRR